MELMIPLGRLDRAVDHETDHAILAALQCGHA